MAKLTVKQLEALPRKAAAQGKPIVINDSGRRGAGALRIRATPAGKILFYFRHEATAGRDDYPLGHYDQDGRGGLTLEGARARADELAKIYRSGVKDIRLHLEAQQRAAEAELKRQQEEQERQEAGSLNSLLNAYSGYLKDNGKPSWKDVASMFRLHVVEPFPDLAERRANEITPRDLRVIFDRLQEKGRTRALGKVRAALHSAYNMSSRAEFDSTIPPVFRGFRADTNPVAPLPTYSKLSKPGERVLTAAELRDLLKALRQDDSMAAKALLVGIYLGGQRPTQLLRVTAADVDQERGTITLHDGKGRRTHARLHVLPLEPVAGQVEECLQVNAEAPSIFSSDGETVPHTTTLSKLAREIGGGKYQLRDVRRTCETELARLGVSKDIRAQILSHELGGIQARHYDRHTYLEEKREALAKWRVYLDGLAAGNVTPLRRNSKSAIA